MPPIDPSIILGLRPAQISQQDPLAQFGKAMALKQSMTAGDLQDLQAQQARRGIADEEAVRGAFRQSGGDNARLRALLTEGGQYKQLQALDKFEMEKREKESTIGKNTAAAEKSKYDVAIDGIQRRASVLSLANPQNWGAIRRQISMDNPQAASSMPEQFDPAWVQTNIAQGQTLTQQLTDQRARETQQITMRGQNMTAESSRRGQDITARGQNMVDARARETLSAGRWTNDLDRGIQVNMATGETRPITTGGAPVNTSPKLTEDQGKATGWLVQADNAYKNMLKATDPKRGGQPSAARPGFPDMVAALPSFGLGATGAAANIMRGESRQNFMQASSSLSEALLRAATGAGVNMTEAEQKIKELTPVFGDSDGQITQKMDAIPLYLESLKVRAGPGAAQLPGIVSRGNAAAGKPATKKIAGVLTPNADGSFNYGAP